ncbi:MAG: hypothetical protein KC731_28225, partial [Myxococcales bacterium]|nr:hypothetical protein [Myxococcales bacterium]
MSEHRWAAAALLLLLACEADPLTPADGPLESVKPVVSIQSVAPPPPVIASDEPPPPVVEPRCAPPSLALTGPLDARDEAALEPCRSASTGPAAAARRCGQGDPAPPLALERLHQAL